MKSKTSMESCVITTSWDDGSSYDRKLTELLSRYSIPATFYIPRYLNRRGLSDREVAEIGRTWEVGGHGIHHRNLAGAGPELILTEINGSQNYLEDLLGFAISSYAFPYGGYSRICSEVLRDSGFLVGRTTQCFSRLPHDWTSMRATIQAAPYQYDITRQQIVDLKYDDVARYLQFDEISIRNNHLAWAELALETLRVVRMNGGIWHLWGHSWEIEEFCLWKELERVFSAASVQKGAVFLSNGRIPEWFDSKK